MPVGLESVKEAVCHPICVLLVHIVHSCAGLIMACAGHYLGSRCPRVLVLGGITFYDGHRDEVTRERH